MRTRSIRAERLRVGAFFRRLRQDANFSRRSDFVRHCLSALSVDHDFYSLYNSITKLEAGFREALLDDFLLYCEAVECDYSELAAIASKPRPSSSASRVETGLDWLNLPANR